MHCRLVQHSYGAAVLLALVAGCTSSEPGDLAIGSKSGALTAEQCFSDAFDPSGKITICHWTPGGTGAAGKYVVTRVADTGCASAHAVQHPMDKVAIGGNCGPNACLPSEAPFGDGLIACCPGLGVNAAGLCADLCESARCGECATCQAATGACEPLAATACDDDDACTADSCDPSSGCNSIDSGNCNACDQPPADAIMLLQFECPDDIDFDSAGDHTFKKVPANGTLSAGVDAAGPNAGVLELNGTAGLNLDTVASDLEFAAGTPFTIDLWVRSRGPQSRIMQMLWFSGAATQNIDIQSNVFLKTSVYWASNGANHMETEVSVSDGEWHHVAFQRDAGDGTLRMFVDGFLRAVGFFDGTLGTNGLLGIGVQNQADFLWDGWLDEVRLSSVALFPTVANIGEEAFNPADYLVEPRDCGCEQSDN